MVLLEWKSFGWIKGLVTKFCKPGEPVVDQFPGTFATAKARSKLPGRRRWDTSETNSECFAASTETLVETYTRNVLNRDSYILSSGEVADVWETVVRALHCLRKRKRMRL